MRKQQPGSWYHETLYRRQVRAVMETFQPGQKTGAERNVANGEKKNKAWQTLYKTRETVGGGRMFEETKINPPLAVAKHAIMKADLEKKRTGIYVGRHGK